MGCYNSTCTITNQSVHAGERIWYVLFEKAIPNKLYDFYSKCQRCQMTELDYSFSKLEIEDMGWGSYNDCGGIEEADLGDNTSGRIVFFHQLAVETFAKGVIEKKDILFKLVNACFSLRRPFVIPPIGEQQYDMDELSSQYQLMKLQKQIIETKRRKLVPDFGETISLFYGLERFEYADLKTVIEEYLDYSGQFDLVDDFDIGQMVTQARQLSITNFEAITGKFLNTWNVKGLIEYDFKNQERKWKK